MMRSGNTDSTDDETPLPQAEVDPLALDTDDVLTFVSSVVTDTSVSVLEVGCGEGRLASRLKALGFRVEGIDRDADAVAAATARGVTVTCGDVLDYSGGPFDVVLFTRSLHHVWPLDAAVAKARELVAPGGLLAIDEFALDEVDERSAAWFFDTVATLDAVGALAPDAPPGHHGHDHGHHGATDEPPPASALQRWARRFRHDPPLHGAQAMRDALGAAFEIVHTEPVPYFHRLVAAQLPPTAEGAQVFAGLRALETGLLDAGLIVPLGRRIVARSPSSLSVQGDSTHLGQ